MAYIKYKEITKYFNFSKKIDSNVLPKYVKDYIYDDEEILVSYKTSRDHGIFTNKKILLFDNTTVFGIKKEITIVPYDSITSCSVIFRMNSCELSFVVGGYPMRIKFINMTAAAKSRLRILYTYITKVMNNYKLTKEEIKNIQENNFTYND